jgi:hypothetical protein
MASSRKPKDLQSPCVCQLVQLSGRRGASHAGAEGEGSIWFRVGVVFFAQSDWRTDGFGENARERAADNPAALVRALEIQNAKAPHGRRLGEILVAEGTSRDRCWRRSSSTRSRTRSST